MHLAFTSHIDRVGAIANDVSVADVNEIHADNTEGGVRQFQPPRGLVNDLAWQLGVVNFDDGNVADREPARDAGATGLTRGGMEIFVPHAALWEGGLSSSGAELAVFVTLSSASGDTMSNQALPAYGSDMAPSADDVPVQAVVSLSIDGSGAVTRGPTISE